MQFQAQDAQVLAWAPRQQRHNRDEFSRQQLVRGETFLLLNYPSDNFEQKHHPAWFCYTFFEAADGRAVGAAGSLIGSAGLFWNFHSKRLSC